MTPWLAYGLGVVTVPLAYCALWAVVEAVERLDGRVVVLRPVLNLRDEYQLRTVTLISGERSWRRWGVVLRCPFRHRWGLVTGWNFRPDRRRFA